MYRVLGSPYVLTFHQHVAYLRLKRLPFKVYCRTFTTTLFYAWVFRARNSFCTVSPDGNSHLQIWQLVDAVESKEMQVRQQHQQQKQLLVEDGGIRNDTILVNKRTHPKIHLVNWVFVLYTSWWLSKTGAMYRWVDGDGVEVVEGYLRYFFLTPFFGVSRAVAGPFRQAMEKITSVTGVSKETAPYMREHFKHLCNALEAHFEQHPELSFLIGTPHPTLADVTLGAAFSANFLMDDPPASLVVQKYPHLNRYLENVTGWHGGVFLGALHPGEFDSSARGDSCNYADVVPESLIPILQLIEEVMPFMLSQCAAFHAFMAGDGIRSLKKEPLEEPWKGCSGYLLSQMTDIKSLMIIDNGIYTISARAQDLEVALLAAREVVGDDDESAKPLGSLLHSSQDASGSMKPIADAQRTEVALDSLSSVTEVGNEKNDINSSGCRDILADDADFHRVFTTTRRSRSVLQPGRVSGQLTQGVMDARLHALRDMLFKMHHPHYTLTTVFHGRKIFVAVIPEHEMVKKRGKY